MADDVLLSIALLQFKVKATFYKYIGRLFVPFLMIGLGLNEFPCVSNLTRAI